MHKRDCGSRPGAAIEAARVLRNVERGMIRRDVLSWDDDEHDFYVQYGTDGVALDRRQWA